MSHTQKAKILVHLDEQCRQIAKRVLDDIEWNMRQRDPAGFINYPLVDLENNPLGDEMLHTSKIDIQDIETMPGFQKIQSLCGNKFYRLAIDAYMDFNQSKPARLLKLTVDGW